MQEGNEELSRWLTAHAERIEAFEQYLASEGEESFIGAPIHEWLVEELEACRKTAYLQPYLSEHASSEQGLLPNRLEQWKYYAALSLYTTVGRSWSKEILESKNYPDPDLGANVSASLAHILAKDGFIEGEPDIYGIVVEYTRSHLHDSPKAAADSIIDIALLLVEADQSSKLSKRKQLQPLDPVIKKDGLTDHIQYHLGPIKTCLSFPKTGKNEIKLLHLAPTASRPYHLVITHGMSHMPMQVPDISEGRPTDRIELMISLPAFWRLDLEALENDCWNWPIDLLYSCAKYPFAMDTYLASGHTINLGDHTYPSDYNSVLVCLSNETPADFDSLRYRGQEVDFYALLPLFPEELKLKLSAGQTELFRELDNNNIGTVIRTNRKNVAAEWYERLFATTLDDNDINTERSNSAANQDEETHVGATKSSQLDAVRSWAGSAVQRILERAQTELPVQNLLDLAYRISKGKANGNLSFSEASQEDVYACSLTAVLVLDANQTVYEWGKEKAVLRLSEQISPIRYELKEICPRLEELVFSTVPFIWALDHRLCIEEATDMASRAKAELNKLHGPGSVNADIHIFEQQGYGALGERNRNSQLDSILLTLNEHLVRNEISLEGWKVGLAGKILLDVIDASRLHGEDSAIQRLAEFLSYECFSNRLGDVVSLLSANTTAAGLGDQETSLRIWNNAIDRVNENLKAKRLEAAKQSSKGKPVQRHLQEIKWSLIEFKNRCLSKNKDGGFPGQNMYRISVTDVQNYLTPSQYDSVVDHFGSEELLDLFVSQANKRFSGYGVSRLKGEIAGLDEQFDFAEYFDLLNRGLSSDKPTTTDFLPWLTCLACDFIFFVLGPFKSASTGSAFPIATSLVSLVLYLFILRPFIYMSQTSSCIFRLYELNDITQNKKRGIVAVRSLSLLVVGVYLLEWTKLTDFFTLPFFIFLFIPMLTAIWPEFVAANFYSLRYCGLRGFFADMKKMQATSGRPVIF